MRQWQEVQEMLWSIEAGSIGGLGMVQLELGEIKNQSQDLQRRILEMRDYL